MFKDLNLLSAIKIGGPVMYLLVACSILSVAIIFERAYCYYRRSLVTRESFMRRIREELAGGGDFEKALTICRIVKSPFSSVVAAGLNVGAMDEKDVMDAMERATIVETIHLEKRTAIVGTIGSTAVYIGLLGTVWGIMKSFHDVSQMGSGGVNVVIQGISEALICTAAGLCVAIPAVAAYNYFMKTINGFITDMELCSSEVSGLIKKQKKAKRSEKIA